ncbi:cytosine permease [Actinomadura vinacea]|uniref:Cytosine permease n=1 Tax=Actinomadura vinacea TaxID=115336 RepID=A0ABN3JJY8_9ACTN
MSPAIGAEDYALARVPHGVRYSWWSVALQRFGQLSALSQFLLGATLGFGMGFWGAFWAITLGAVILEVVSIFVGVIGVREGISTSMLARWTGFGRGGSALIGLAIGISLIGWFGVQTAVSAEGMAALVGADSAAVPMLALFMGLAVTAIVVFGFHGMAWTAYLTVPAFMILVAWSISSALVGHSLGELVSSVPPGPHLTFLEGTTLVAGGFIVGAVITPDMTRYNRGPADVVKQTVLGITLGEYIFGLSGVLLAHAFRTDNVISIVTSSVGWVGVLIIILGTLKINDWNLYSSGLGLVNIVGLVFGRRVPRVPATLVVGIAGSTLAAGGILERFTDFLILLGVAFPPIPGIMIAEYFIVRRWRGQLETSRAAGRPPSTVPTWVPVTLVIWAVSTVTAKYVTLGISSVNALLLAFVLYLVAGRLGLVQGIGTSVTETAREPASEPGRLTEPGDG